ncbi:hypothetical protein EC900039_3842A, partial [Escherichia coli 90.0039]
MKHSVPAIPGQPH